jgi:hypothetical protein
MARGKRGYTTNYQKAYGGNGTLYIILNYFFLFLNS